MHLLSIYHIYVHICTQYDKYEQEREGRGSLPAQENCFQPQWNKHIYESVNSLASCTKREQK